MDDRAAFVAQIEAAPLDHLLRCVFADWLDERGESDEADRQRKWVAAYEHVRDAYVDPYWKRYRDDPEYADPADPPDAHQPPAHATVMEHVADWLEQLAADSLCFPLASVFYRVDGTEAEREAFFDALTTLTGRDFPRERRRAARFGCSC